jgi:hypothetical protein
MKRVLLAVGVFVLLIGATRPTVSDLPFPECWPCTSGTLR